MCQLYKIPISTRFILSYANNVYLSRRHYFGNDSLDIAMHKQGVTGALERIGTWGWGGTVRSNGVLRGYFLGTKI